MNQAVSGLIIIKTKKNPYIYSPIIVITVVKIITLLKNKNIYEYDLFIIIIIIIMEFYKLAFSLSKAESLRMHHL